ncbi:hypothetical protein PV08_11400 [Exophiala spinifera]|uniref:histidine kinase n=1 Tax=Exophiala spinifera TaxID=91928 RepID=A0A0D1Y6D1_9EURO|nr:uncharacterized protein PV08_11400 [Exophiala spinifera]KIW10436.1 hypothetical protein PV08_11400 [Exophiala spinifera]
MKSSKSSHPGLSPRGRSSRLTEGHGSSTSQTRSMPGGEDTMSENRNSQSAPDGSSSLAHQQATQVLARELPGDIEAMRRRMGLALAQKQQMRASAVSAISVDGAKQSEPVESAQPLLHTESSSDESVNTGTLSTDSARTIRATLDATPGTIRTPSYPFPRMAFRLNRGISQRSGPSHKPFTLLSPTNEPPVTGTEPAPTQLQAQASSSELSTPIGQTPLGAAFPEDPNFPAPDLLECVLVLNSEPGLDMWWANVTDILNEFGAERASLAVPGDITDLENVPWGQKATYNCYGSDAAPPSQLDSTTASDLDTSSVGRRPEPSSRTPSDVSTLSTRRPPLLSRHSIAGPVPDPASRSSRQRPAGPIRAYSSAAKEEDGQASTVTAPVLPRLTKQPATPRSSSLAESNPLNFKGPYNSSGSASSTLRCHVHRSLQPLEAERDPLLVRTGVVSLFNKRKPVILTRAYSEEVPKRSPLPRGSEDLWTAPRTPSAAAAEKIKANNMEEPQYSIIRAFDEYEQPEPSPWSQSPSPSPAARPDPEESPFFNPPTASIDETAFEQNPPVYDYATTANQSLNAIGADMSKTLVHIPLIQPILARGTMASNLRFPVAILSFISNVNPFPLSWRRALEALLPHIASSYSLAQQYSALQDRLRGAPGSRHGAAFGLGGTFSDEGSELELVAELSEQIALDREQPRSWTTYDASSPSGLKDSPSSSLSSTPHLEHLGLSPGLPPTPGRSASDMVDSYFSTRRQRGTQQPLTPGPRPTKDDGEQSKRSTEKVVSTSKAVAKKSANIKTQAEAQMQSPVAKRAGSNASGSEIGDQIFDRADSSARRSTLRRYSQSKDEEKPLPELISSLMLNSVPLQLFLAKPTTGDLVWTNRKFDAFRSQGEGRVRDPWKNVHSADRNGLVKLWNDALRTGSQFTHYIRVKRFNSDNDFRWFVFRASTLLTNNGRLLYWIGSFLDVHEQYMKNLEASEKEAIMARETKIRALADAIPQILFEAIEGDGIVAVNQQWHAYSGQTLEEARGLGFAKHVHRDDLHKCGILSPSDIAAIARSSGSNRTDSSSDSNKTAAPSLPTRKNLFSPDLSSLDQMIKSGSVMVEKDENGQLYYLTEIRLRSKGGEYRWFLVRLVRVETGLWQTQSGKASWYGTCTDIETRKALERKLNEANEKVHREMESKTKFFANMSHEIRTPLNGIIGSMPWLVESSLDHDQRRTVDTIQNSANNLRELVDNILDVTKVEAGKMTLFPKWFHVRSLCEEVIDTVSSRAIERGLALNYSLETNVPSTVKGDAFRVRQVLLNLLGNSVKFTEQGEVYMRCSLRVVLPTNSSEDAGKTLLLNFDVIDTGRGFNEDEFQRLFKQFGQIGGGTSHEAGSGLGLFLSKQLVEMHGGELSVQSKAGEGSVFSFYVKVEMELSGAEPSVTPSTAAQSSTQQATMLNASARSRSDNKVPMTSVGKRPSQSIIQTPGLSRYVSVQDQGSPAVLPSPATPSPAVISPSIVTSADSGVSTSVRSNSGPLVNASTITSLVPTPESAPSRDAVPEVHEQRVSETKTSTHPAFRRSKSDNDGRGLSPAHPQTYSIIIVCPAEHARMAIKQHIEHVVPYQIAANVTTIPDIGSFLDLINGRSPPSFTHVVLDIPATSDIMLFMRQMATYSAPVIPALVVITDHYQKRDILEDFTALTSTGRKAFLIHKPVKPSVFAMIFDPAQLRNLSKDRAREVAQSSSDDFQQIVRLVKEKIGNGNKRLLLVEDSEVNRRVIQRYFLKTSLANECAKNGQECVDMVKEKGPGYYSLIICDIQMPIKNGYEACREIREWEQSHGYQPCPIMALTANAMPEERAAAANAGFTDYLTKPVDFNLLGTMMMTLLDPSVPHVFLRDRPLET